MANITQQQLGMLIATLVQNAGGGGAVGKGVAPWHNAVPAAPTGNPVPGLWNMGPPGGLHQGVILGMTGMGNTAPGAHAAHGMSSMGLQCHGMMPGMTGYGIPGGLNFGVPPGRPSPPAMRLIEGPGADD
jgi:hypothetical protein